MAGMAMVQPYTPEYDLLEAIRRLEQEAADLRRSAGEAPGRPETQELARQAEVVQSLVDYLRSRLS